MGLDIEKFPALHVSNQVVGRVSAKAAEATGIPANTPVVCGGGDFACACLGAGVLQPGQAAMMLGTAGNLLVPATPRMDERLFNTVHVTGETLSLGGVLAGGSVRWFTEMIGLDVETLLPALEVEAAAVPPGAEGLLFLPYLLGERTPIWDPQARGAFLGLSTRHGRGHLYRAVLEGVALAYRQMAEIFAEMGRPIGEVIAINGGARSPLWRQIFADVLQTPVRWRPESGGTALGAAFLAAWGVGDFRSPAELRGWLEPTVDTFPEPSTVHCYAVLYPIFCQLYDRLKDSFHTLAEKGAVG
jgi:xylulokinase